MSRRNSWDNHRRQSAVQRAQGSAIDRFVPKTSRKFKAQREWAARNRKKISHSRKSITHNFPCFRVLTLTRETLTANALFSRVDRAWRCLSVDHPEIDWLRRVKNFDTLAIQIKQWISKHNFQMTWGPALSKCPATLGQHPSKPSVELPVDRSPGNASPEDKKTESPKNIIPIGAAALGVASDPAKLSSGRRVMG